MSKVSKSRKGRSRKAKLVEADQVTKYLATWRVAEALSNEVRGELAPLITYEAPERWRPWDDVVESYGEDTLQLYQVKSGTTIRAAEVRDLFVGLKKFPNARATLALTDSPSISASLNLRELASALRALRSGANINREDDPAEAFLLDACGGLDEARDIANRLSVEFLGGRDTLKERAMKSLSQIYPEEIVAGVLAQIQAALEETVGRSLRMKDLIDGKLSRFAVRATATQSRRERSAQERYLTELQAAVGARRVLRILEGSGALLGDVWVCPRLRPTGLDPVNLPDLGAHLREGEEHNVVGPAGSGKTELLANLASHLSGRALRQPDLALPLVFNLRDLNAGLDGSSIVRAAEQFSSGVGESLARLIDASGVRWLLLIDGVDEVKHGAEVVAALRRRFRGSTSVATLRPSLLHGMGPGNVFWVEPWRESDAVNFLRQLATAYPVAAERLVRLTEGVPGLLQAPLTATLAAVVTIQGGVAPRSRTQLFRQAIDTLVQNWADARGVKNPWRSIAPAMRAVALELVRNERTSISPDELDDRLHHHAPEEALLIKQSAERDFGILIRLGESYEFLVRGMAEYLAGEQLAERGDELVSVCGMPWAQDAGRHAVALLTARDPTNYTRALRELSAQGPREAAGLRRLLVAISAAADNPACSPDVAAQVAAACISALRNEASPWRADRVAEAVSELAKGDGPVWRLLREPLRMVVRDHRRPADYFAARSSDPAGVSEMLLHCDPEVRSEGIRRLDGSGPGGIDLLFTMLHDVPTFPRFGAAPAIEAGLALRRAPRDLLGEYLPALRAISQTPSQLLSTAAAVALRPHEQNRDFLVQAYRRGADGLYLPRAVLEELADDVEGAAALERLWPDWRAYPAQSSLLQNRAASPSSPELSAPPSDLTRARLVRVLGSEPVLLVDVTADVLSGPGSEHFIEAICERAIAHPDLASRILTMGVRAVPVFSYRSSLLLANVAMRHNSVRQALLGLWQQFDAHPESRSRFPGRALEHLVGNGDLEAAKVYATWLPYAPFLSGLLDEPAPDPDVFRNSVTRQAAQERLADIALRATVGFEQNGERFVVAALSAARAFQKLESVWRGDTVVTPILVGWLDATEPERRFAALSALSAGLDQQQRAKAVVAIQRFLHSREETDRHFRLPHLIPHIERLGLIESFISELRSLAQDNAPFSIVAACVLRSKVSPGELVEISTQVSRGTLHSMAFEAIARDAFEELVKLAPRAWSDAAFRAATQAVLPEIDVAAPILEVLPVDERRALAQRLADHVGSDWKLPWLTSWRANFTYRPSDLVAQLLFAAGMS